MVKECNAKIARQSKPSFWKVSTFFRVSTFFGFFVLYLQTSLLCIVGKIAGGGAMAVAIGVGDSWQVTSDT